MDGVAQLAIDAVGPVAAAVDPSRARPSQRPSDWPNQNPVNWILQWTTRSTSVEDMTERIDISSITPEGYRKVINLDGYAGQNVENPLRDLVNLRASQLNGCTFCVDMHSVDLQAAGVPLRKIFSVITWRESEWFSEREKIALELTEEITRIEGGVPDELWDRALAEFGDRGLADLVLAISTINVWNRIAISTRMLPPALEPALS